MAIDPRVTGIALPDRPQKPRRTMQKPGKRKSARVLSPIAPAEQTTTDGLRTIRFELPQPLMLLNGLLRTNHWGRASVQKKLSWQVAAAVQGVRPDLPFARVRITVIRHSVGMPDTDGLYGSVKPLLDVLQPASKRHPHGLGIIANDSADACALTVLAHKAIKRADQKTVVMIEELRTPA